MGHKQNKKVIHIKSVRVKLGDINRKYKITTNLTLLHSRQLCLNNQYNYPSYK